MAVVKGIASFNCYRSATNSDIDLLNCFETEFIDMVDICDGILWDCCIYDWSITDWVDISSGSS